MYEPSQLTGAIVLAVREQHKMSRDAFSALVGFTGKSTARLSNIEKKDSWKPGDRERLAEVINDLMRGEQVRVADTSRHQGGGTAIVPAVTSTPAQLDDEGQPIPPFIIPLPIGDADDETELILTVGFESAVVGPRVSATSVMPLVEELRTRRELPLIELQQKINPTLPAFSNSELRTWKTCRRKWWLAWYRRYQLNGVSFTDVRATGTRVHRALEAWYVPEGEPRVDPRDALERVIVDDWTKITTQANERGLSEERHAALAVDFTTATNLERAMVEGYVQWLAETGEDSELRIVGSEQPIVATLETEVDYGARSGVTTREFQLIGVLDTRVTRVSDNARLFIDHKTVGDVQGPVATLPQNEQMLHYHLLEWLAAESAEARCDGALYNMLRRVKRSARAKPPFYSRIEVRHNRYELDSYKRRAVAAARDIMVATHRLEVMGEDHRDVAYPTPGPDCRWSCDFFAVCNLFDDGSRAEDMIAGLYTEGNPLERYERKGGGA